MAYENRWAEFPSTDNLMQIRDIMASTVGPFTSPWAVAVTALVESHHMKMFGEGRSDEIPPVRMS